MEKSTKILVTGGRGFLGQHLTKKLSFNGYNAVFAPSRNDLDLMSENRTMEYLYIHKPEVVIHLAAVVGGIGANMKSPGTFFEKNMKMGMNVINAANRNGASVVYVSTLCEYPKFTQVPFKEEDIWSGYPEETNAPYAVAKKALRVMLDAYRKEFGLKSISLIPSNMAGEYDHFDLENSHVIPALIRKVQAAIDDKKDTIEVWGDGSASREFLYAGDCADAVILAMESGYDGSEGPVNIGTGREITIRNLITLICDQMNYKGQIKWLTDKPNGQPRRAVDGTKAERLFGFKAETSLEEIIMRTVKYWNEIKDATK